MKHSIFFTLFFLIFNLSVHAQEGDYIVKSTGDTIFCTNEQFIQNNGISTLTMLEDGKKVNYSPKDVYHIFHNEKHYCTANVSFGTQASSNNLSFVQLVADGKMQLLKIEQSTGGGVNVVVHYARNKVTNETIKVDLTWKKNLAKLGANCTPFLNAVENSKFKDWSNEIALIALVKIFSDKCE
jgi:hypothetical protein